MVQHSNGIECTRQGICQNSSKRSLVVGLLSATNNNNKPFTQWNEHNKMINHNLQMRPLFHLV